MSLASALALAATLAAGAPPPPPIDIGRYYPERAQRLEIEGRVVLSCTVLNTGLLTDCTVVEETPPDYGFGEAALRMSALFRMKPSTRDGQPMSGAKVTVPIAFRLPDLPSPSPATTYEQALVCHGVWNARVHGLFGGEERSMRDQFAAIARTRGAAGGYADDAIEAGLKASRRSADASAPIPDACRAS